ncbi:TPA: BppU family phage baseplate upper protein [Enterococcus faecium]
MASSLYNLALDFSKELNYTKAIMARQGDKGITVTVKPFLNGLQMDTSGGTFTLKGTTPSNRYVDSVATSVTSEEVTFSLDGTFMSEAGYYKHCYVEYRKDNQILTTQDIIFFSLGVSDISQGQADEYVSQLEELIRKYNETFDAFMAEIKGRVDSLNQQITDLTGQAKTLQDKLDALKEEISKLGNLQVMYSNSLDFGDYDYSTAPNLLHTLDYSKLSRSTSVLTQPQPYIKDYGDYFVLDANDSSAVGRDRNCFVPLVTRLTKGKTYTLSVSMMFDDEFADNQGYARSLLSYTIYTNNPATSDRPVVIYPSADMRNQWKRVSKVFTVPADQKDGDYVYLQLYQTAGTKGKLYVRYDMMIQEGDQTSSQTTGWKPNLLDEPYYLSKAPLGENIANKSVAFPIKTSAHEIYRGNMTEELVIGQTYTITLKGTKPSSQTFVAYNTWNVKLGELKPVEGLSDVWSLTFTPTDVDSSSPKDLRIYQNPESTVGPCQIDWLKIEKGDTRTPNVEQYKYRGIGMRDSNNPKDYVWDLAPEYVEDNLATDVKISEITGKANNYTDGKVSQINSQLTASINEVDKKVTANTSKIATNTTNIKTISDAMPLYAIYSEGRDLTDSPDGTKIPIGALVATDFAHTASDLPYTISSDGITLTATRNCVLFFEGSVKLHGNNTFKFAYVKIRKNGSDTNFANVGSSANLNYMTSQAGQYVHTLVAGDKVEFTLGIDAAAKMFHLQLLSLKISEVKPV